jgi:hypothetical protein
VGDFSTGVMGIFAPALTEIAFTKSEIVLVSFLATISSGSVFGLGWPNTVWRIM